MRTCDSLTASSASSQASNHSAITPWETRKILIVIASPQQCHGFCQILVHQSHDFYCVTGAIAALNWLKHHQPHLILLDVRITGMDVYELCRRIKAHPQTQAIPVIFTGASREGFDFARVVALGLRRIDYIPDPLEIQEALLRINTQLELQSDHKQLDDLNTDLIQRVAKRTLQLKAVHSRLKLSEAKLKNILSALQDVVWSAAIEPFQILYLNPVAERLFGYPLEEFMKNSRLWFELIHPDDRWEVTEAMNSMSIRGSIDIEYRIVLPNGTERWVKNRSHLVIGEEDSVSVRLEGIITDISDRKRAESQLVHDALHDGLTQLPNRTLFLDRLERALARKQRSPDYGFAVLFLDLNRFKVINDSLGHTAGDQLLIEVAERLLSCLRGEDTVARLGGDEFTVLLEEVTRTEEAIACVRKIQSALHQPVIIEGKTVFTEASIGIVMAKPTYQNGHDLLRDADIAMYRAKESRQSGYALFDQGMHSQMMRRLKLEHDMRLSLENGDFEMYYQPIVSLQSETLVGLEALIRWRNPDVGMVQPDEFIPIAEDTGFIVPLGNWILQTACQQLKQWQQLDHRYRHLKINVNLASQQLRSPDLLTNLDKILTEADLSGESLRLEVTESVLIEQTEAAINTLKQIRQRGIQLSIDDFGTGYSSLSYLSRLPINNLKIDKSFVSRMHLEADSLEIVRTIVALAQTLGMDVTAEGIEEDVQLYLLNEFNCEYGQGYYFTQPLSAEDLTPRLLSWPAPQNLPPTDWE